MSYTTDRKSIAVIIAFSMVALAVDASVLFYVQNQPILGCLGCGPSQTLKESLVMESSHLNSPTNLTLTIRNAGPSAVALVEYMIRDNSNNRQFNNTQYQGPTIMPNTVVGVNLLIDGIGFTFQAGHTYTIQLVTARNNLYAFTITL